MNDEDQSPTRHAEHFGTADFESTSSETPAPLTPVADDPAAALPTDSVLSLPTETRIAFRFLMANGQVLASDRRSVYLELVRHRHVIEQILGLMGLHMAINEHYGFCVLMRLEDVEASPGSDEDDPAAPETVAALGQSSGTLLHVTPLSLQHSIVLWAVRRHFREREHIDHLLVRINRERLETLVNPYMPDKGSDSKRDQVINGAVDTLSKHGILSKVRGSDDEWMISPIVTVAMDAVTLSTYTDLLKGLLEEQRTAGEAS